MLMKREDTGSCKRKH